MKNLFLILAIAFFAAAASPSARAQSVYGEAARRDGFRLLEIGKALAQVPEKGERAEDFVPPHWKIYARADGDLNADKANDFALILKLDEADAKYYDALVKASGDEQWVKDAFIILVADTRADRKPHFGSVNYNLFDVSLGNERDEFDVAIKGNVLSVHVNYGGSMRWDAKFSFRFDPPTGGRLGLIGFDYEVACVTMSKECTGWRLSENYLTGTRLETDYKLKGIGLAGTDKKRPLAAPVKIDFESARLNESNMPDVRPF